MIHEEHDNTLDFSWLLFIGHCLLGFTEKEVGRMTLRKLSNLYRHYKNNYDFKLCGKSYYELDEENNHKGEFMPD